MNKNAIKSFAIDARNWLRDKMEIKLGELGITSEGVSGVYQQTETEVKVTDLSAPINRVQYENLKKYIGSLKKSYGDNWYNELLEESAYIWFNRIVGIKYMEVNGYLPENINILTSTTGRVEPDIVTSYEYLGYADSLDKNFIRNGILNHDTEGVFRYLFLMENHQLSKIMPFMFAKENDFSDLVFPNNILGENGIIGKINSAIEEEDWKEIEIIGWLYQFYNQDKRSLIFDSDMSNRKKVEKADIPAATQIFTPKWIVKHIVDNTVGKLLSEKDELSDITKELEFYIKAKNENPKIANDTALEDIKIFDPSMGSGHILVYTFDLLYKAYELSGVSRREAVVSIINNNLYGLDIDDRAATLASFALVMKGREYFPRLFNLMSNEEIEVNTLSIQESNGLETGIIDSLKGHNLLELIKLIELFNDAKEYGSILKIEGIDIEKAEEEFKTFENKETLFYSEEKKLLKTLIKQVKVLTQKYDVTVTNPPYMGNARLNEKLKKFVQVEFPETKTDLFAMFMWQSTKWTKPNGLIGFVTPYVWMFIKSYEELRDVLIKETTFNTLIQLEYNAFEGACIPVGTFTLINKPIVGYKGDYIKLSDFRGIENQPIKTREAIENPNIDFRYSTFQQDFYKIPGSPIAYWVSDKVKEIFEKNRKLGDVGDAKQGLSSADNNRFIRLWSEISNKKIYKKWFPFNKGGGARKWYGNFENLINWENDGEEIKKFKNSVIRNPNYYMRKGLTWSDITSGMNTFRYLPENFVFGDVGPSFFIEESQINQYLGILNNKFYDKVTKILNPTMHFQVGVFSCLPSATLNMEKVNDLVQININVAKFEWDSRETSWDFIKNQLAMSSEQVVVKEAYNKYCEFWKEKFYEMHRNEEELNRLFIEIYGLEDEMTPDVDLKDITLLKKELLRRKSAKKATEEEEAEEAGLILDDKGEIQFNKEEIIKQFISYAIGCNMGRYSIDKEGLIIANSDDKLVIENEQLKIVGVLPLANPNNNPMPSSNPNESEKIGFSNGKPLQTNESIDENIRHIIPNPRYTPDNDGIIPVTDTNYFVGEDVVERFEEFLIAVYDKENLEENFKFIAEAMKDSKNEPREVLREYFMGDFYADHLQRYSKRPIYWLVSSNGKGKGAAFNAYIYLHRYNKNTIPTIRGKYVNELQAKLKSKEDLIEKRLLDDSLSIKEKKELKDEKDRYRKQLNELLEFDKKLNSLSNQMIELDLDDGVKVNYEKLADILYKVKM